ncbi:MAG: hypothetical protein IJ806_03910 [Ruminococcus sp.]|nr:hypothetical protein [Ruminococcus sp.]
MEKISDTQKKLMQRKFYEIHELIRNQEWNKLETNNLYCKCSKEDMIEDILFELAEYPGTVTYCTFDEFILGVNIEDDGILSNDQILACASVFLDGKMSDLSIECIFSFDNDIITKTYLTQVHVF